MNSFFLVGRLIEDAIQTETTTGTKMSRIKVAVDKSNKDQQVTKEIFEVILFRTLAEKQLFKNDAIAISGKVQANNYEKDDVSYYNCNLIASSLYVLE